MPTYFAHSRNLSGNWHELTNHLRAVANSARIFSDKFGGGEFGYWAGLWHDLGKFTQEFQDYLKTPEKKRGPDHSSAGAIHAFPSFEELARIVAGHHSGVPDNNDLERRISDKNKKKLAQEAIDRTQEALGVLTPACDLTTTLPAFIASADTGQERARSVEFFSRMLFSALTDSDFLDTEKHFESSRNLGRSGSPSLQEVWVLFEHDQNRLSGKPGNRLQEIRHDIYRRCLQAAVEQPGIFTLTVPTGGGKTRSGLAFAIKHALRWELDRIIVAIPYTSIIEQTADIYRRIFRDHDRCVLEHHSAVATRQTEASDPVTLEAAWSRLASENWDAPLVVTTTVQLFESLLANRPAKCRKLHNVARSVLILDEVQTLPTHLLTPLLEVLQHLADHYRVTVVLCTATQPALTSHASFRGLHGVRDIIDVPARYFAQLKRVRYDIQIVEPWSWQRVAQEMQTTSQCLAIVNTKKDAFALLDALSNDPSALHLSTQMCGIHRLEILNEVRRRLNPAVSEPCRLVSTQVVEAGVDLDFPLVLRAVGPLDRIVQAAGRCNREMRLTEGRVVIFDPSEGSFPPGIYETAIHEAESMLRRGCDLDDPKTFEQYFRQLYGTIGPHLDKHNIQAARARFDYPQVARDCRVIEDADTALAVVRPKGHEATVDRLLMLFRTNGESPRWLLRKLQPFVVNIRQWAIPAYQRQRILQEIVSGSGIWEWLGRYDSIRGLVDEAKELVI
jgi:CRISPR-associated endonuclease/helicase Cas3